MYPLQALSANNSLQLILLTRIPERHDTPDWPLALLVGRVAWNVA